MWLICILLLIAFAEFWYILYLSDKKSEALKKNADLDSQNKTLERSIQYVSREWDYAKEQRDKLEDQLCSMGMKK